MAHIHLPDGVLPIEWVAAYWAISAALLGIVLLYFRRSSSVQVGSLALAGAATALAFVLFQIEVPVLGGIHLNLTPFLGIVLGPAMGAISAIIVNILGAAVGHGGWGPIGLNFIINLIEIVAAFAVFRLVYRRWGNPFAVAFMATLIALSLSNAFMVGSLTASGIQGVEEDGLEVTGLSLIAIVNEAAAVIESIVTGFLVAFLAKVKPGLIGGSGGAAS